MESKITITVKKNQSRSNVEIPDSSFESIDIFNDDEDIARYAYNN